MDVTDDAASEIEKLFAAHSADLTRFAIRRVGVDAAADVVSETFLIAWRQVTKIPPDHARAWLFATARHVIQHEIRSSGRRDALRDKTTGPALVSDDHADLVADQVLVAAILDRLSAREREALMLAEWDRLSTPDAARVMGCSVSAYKVRLFRARKRFAALAESTQHPDENTERAVSFNVVADQGNFLQ